MKRVKQIDFLRGLFLIIMTVDHFGTPLRRFTYQTFGYVSAAEGFVFVSGLVAGIVYAGKIDKYGIHTVRKQIFVRSLEVYLYHIVILIVLTLLLHRFEFVRMHWHEDQLLYDKPILGFVLSALFLYQPDHLNILPIYCIFLVFTPLAFQMLMRGKILWILCISVGIWLASLSGLRDILSSYLGRLLPINLGYFNFFSWQLLFFTGLIFGYLKKENKLNAWMHNKWLFSTCIVMGGLLFFSKFLNVDDIFPEVVSFLVHKSDLGPVRVLNFAILTFIIVYLLYKNENAGKFSPVAFLGQHSLQVFTFHVLMTIVLVPIVNGIEFQLFDNFMNQQFSKIVKVGVVCLLVLVLFIPAYLHESTNKKKKIKVS